MCSVCARSRGGWSQVISGVVTLGRLSPRPRLCAPVGACRRVRACACVRARSFRRGVGVVWRLVWCGVWCRCWRCGVVSGSGCAGRWRHTFFHLSLSLGIHCWALTYFSWCVRACLFSFYVSFYGSSLGSSLVSSLLSISMTIKNVI